MRFACLISVVPAQPFTVLKSTLPDLNTGGRECDGCNVITPAKGTNVDLGDPVGDHDAAPCAVVFIEQTAPHFKIRHGSLPFKTKNPLLL